MMIMIGVDVDVPDVDDDDVVDDDVVDDDGVVEKMGPT